MAEQVLSIAVVRPDEGKAEECAAVIRELYAVLQRKNYSRDLLYRDTQNPELLVNLRYWTSPQARQDAHEDPEIHRYWLRLGQLCKVVQVYEELEEIQGSASSVG